MEILVIVESPSKAKTLRKYLGSGYVVGASMGHIRDLPKKDLGVDVDNGFKPTYVAIEGKERQIKDLKALAKGRTQILLASDPDREGEAIAWHLAAILKIKNPQRVEFHEITKTVVQQAVLAPRAIDYHLVAAQEARRVIDRLVGYKLSPLVMRSVKGRSAGRVQSVAVRLVVDREEAIRAFVPEESWSLTAKLETAPKENFLARLFALTQDLTDDDTKVEDDTEESEDEKSKKKEKLILKTQVEALEVMKKLQVTVDGQPTAATPPFEVIRLQEVDRNRKPPLPYTTSTVQQDASTRLRIGPKRTMALAQQLYEGIELGAEGPTGLITYMRTDSTRISEEAASAARNFIAKTYGERYKGDGQVRQSKKNQELVQDAHEAIRPTNVERTPESMQSFLDAEQMKLYELIWKRFVASQMAVCQQKVTTAILQASIYLFRSTGTVTVFDGYTQLWKDEKKDKEKEDSTLPSLTIHEQTVLLDLKKEQHFTDPPPRFTEASLIKELEARGVGRPSTYAATIEVIQERSYVEQKERKLFPTALGVSVVGWLKTNFADIIDIEFTAQMEKKLDEVERGTRQYAKTVEDWYTPFATNLETVEKSAPPRESGGEKTGALCPECGEGELEKRTTKNGAFISCSRYPECTYSQNENAQLLEEECPECQRPLVEIPRKDGKGTFIGCSGFRQGCKYIKRETLEGDGTACPQCGDGVLNTRSGKFGMFLSCSKFPECKYIVDPNRKAPELSTEVCPRCGKQLTERHSARGAFWGCSGYPACNYIKQDKVDEMEGSGKECPKCHTGKLATRTGRYGTFLGCDTYPACDFIERNGAIGGQARPAPKIVKGKCPQCGSPLAERKGQYGVFVGCTGYPKCRYIKKD